MIIPDEDLERLAEESSSPEVISEAEARFDRLRKRLGLYAAPFALGLTYLATAGRLTDQGARLSAILACVLVLWVSEAIPLPVTALFGACLCIVLGVAEAKTVLAPFADPIMFLFVGSFMLARAMMLHRLDRRFALAILSLPWVGGRPARLLLALGLVTALLSMWVSNTATTAMMLPIAIGILNALREMRIAHAKPGDSSAPHSHFATGVMLMIAYGASIGGIGTPVGSPPNLIGIGLIKKLAGVEINFFKWMAVCVPLLTAMFVALYALLYWLHPPARDEGGSEDDMRAYLGAQRDALGGWTAGQKNTLFAFGCAVAAWVTPGILATALDKEHAWVKFAATNLPEAVVALLAAALLFVLPTNRERGEFTLTWEDAARIDWGTILLFGGGLSLGSLMFSTGVADAVGKAVTALTGAQSLWSLTAVAIAMAIGLSEATSNTASANMVIPVVIALAQAAHISPVPPALGACLGASYGFMLPVSTAPNAMVYGTGLVPIPRMMRAGIVFDACGFVIIFAGLRMLCPALGLV